MCCARSGRGVGARALLAIGLLVGALFASGLSRVARGDSGEPREADARSELSILTYNIYYGGQPHDPVLVRDHEWLHVIEARSPDVILIDEANGWLPSEQNFVAAYVESLNTAFPDDPPYVGFVGDARTDFNVAVLSRVPVLAFEAFTDVDIGGQIVQIRHVFTHATLLLAGERVHVLGVHFRPGPYRAERELEARALLAILDDLPPGDTVWIGGDFNSYSPVDVAPGSLTPPDYAAGADPPEVKGWEPLGYLLGRGYEDAFRTRHPYDLGYTQDTAAFIPGGVPKQRVDFLARTPGSPWRLAYVEVADDALGDIGSDHYAVFTRYTRASAGVLEPVALDLPRLRAWPNPARGEVRIALDLDDARSVEAQVLSLDGRLVRTLAGGRLAAGEHILRWDGADRFGRPLGAGVYLVRCGTASGATSLTITRLP
jgi:endonuclease/exonuclease/phosphatase family metal-dependent hydrolase